MNTTATDLPTLIGPLCADWYELHPAEAGCAHDSCYRIAHREPPAHDCPYETFAEDPISIHYGLASTPADYVTCAVCDAWYSEATYA